MLSDITDCVHVLTMNAALMAVCATLGFPWPSAFDTLVEAAPTLSEETLQQAVIYVFQTAGFEGSKLT